MFFRGRNRRTQARQVSLFRSLRHRRGSGLRYQAVDGLSLNDWKVHIERRVSKRVGAPPRFRGIKVTHTALYSGMHGKFVSRGTFHQHLHREVGH